MAKSGSNMGSWAFIVGVIIAVLVGLFGMSSQMWAIYLLIVIGLIVGFMNVTGNEANSFLMASIALVIVSAFGKNVLSAIAVLGNILDAMMVLVVPATIIVALKAVHGLAKD